MTSKFFKITETKSVVEILKYFNYLHDASLTKLIFIKRRDIDKEDGSLVYPFGDIARINLCDIKARVLHNNYRGAKLEQSIDFYFGDTQSFEFVQNKDFDYSDIYHVDCTGENDRLKFTFYCTSARIPALKIICACFRYREK